MNRKPSLATAQVKAREGFFMTGFLPDSPPPGSGRFRQVTDAFLAGEGLPFAHILSAERMERVFAQHGCLFGLRLCFVYSHNTAE